MDGFCTRARPAEHACDVRAHVPTMNDVAFSVAEVAHEAVEDVGGVFEAEVAVRGWRGREAVARERGDDDVVWKGMGDVFGLYKPQQREEFEEAAWPPVQEEKWDGSCIGGVHGDVVDQVFVTAFEDMHVVVAERVDFIFCFSPALELAVFLITGLLTPRMSEDLPVKL